MPTHVVFKIPGKSTNQASTQLFSMSYGSKAITPRNLHVSISQMANQSLGRGGHGSAGSRQKTPIVVTKQTGIASPLLLNAHWKSEVFASLDINLVEPNPKGGETVHSTITLTNAAIVGYLRNVPKLIPPRFGQSRPHSNDTHEWEQIAISFQKITISGLRGKNTPSDEWTG